MPRWLVWIPGAVLLAAGLVAIPLLGTAPAPTARASAPRVVVLSQDHATVTLPATRARSASSAPEIVLAGEASTASPAPARRRASAGPRVIEQVIYVDAPAEEPAPRVEAPVEVASAASEPAVFEEPAVASTIPGPPPGTVRTRSSSRSGEIARRAAIGAGIGAILGGRQGAVGGAIGGVLGGIGGRGRAGGCSQRLEHTNRIAGPSRIVWNGGM